MDYKKEQEKFEDALIQHYGEDYQEDFFESEIAERRFFWMKRAQQANQEMETVLGQVTGLCVEIEQLKTQLSSLTETLHLYSSPANAQRLEESIDQAERGDVISVKEDSEGNFVPTELEEAQRIIELRETDRGPGYFSPVVFHKNREGN